MTNVVAYIRVSTQQQVQEGEGLEIQKDRISKFCEKNNYKLFKTFSDEGISGAKEICDRPAILEMLEYCKNPPIQYVIIDKPDRLSRDFTEMLYIEKQLLVNNVRVLYAVQESLNGDDIFVDAMRKMMGVFAELDRKMINKRLSDGKRKKSENGNKASGRQPFGYEYSQDKKSTIINPYQAKIIQDMFKLKISGKSYQAIADTLNKRRDTLDKEAYTGNNKDRHWDFRTVHRTMNNIFYIGKLTHAEKVFDGNHKAIINMNMWKAVHGDKILY